MVSKEDVQGILKEDHAVLSVCYGEKPPGLNRSERIFLFFVTIANAGIGTYCGMTIWESRGDPAPLLSGAWFEAMIVSTLIGYVWDKIMFDCPVKYILEKPDGACCAYQNIFPYCCGCLLCFAFFSFIIIMSQTKCPSDQCLYAKTFSDDGLTVYWGDGTNQGTVILSDSYEWPLSTLTIAESCNTLAGYSSSSSSAAVEYSIDYMPDDVRLSEQPTSWDSCTLWGSSNSDTDYQTVDPTTGQFGCTCVVTSVALSYFLITLGVNTLFSWFVVAIGIACAKAMVKNCSGKSSM